MSDEKPMSIREALSKAIDATPAEAPPPAAAPDVPPAEAAPAAETEAQRAERVRDEAGRFAKQAKVRPADGIVPPETPIGKAPPAELAKPPDAPKAPEIRPPQSLTPAEREAFAKAPPEIQQAIARRERETGVALQEAAKAKQFAQEFERTIAPYMPMVRAGSGDPLKTVAGLLQTAHVLSSGPAQQKADIVAQIVKMYGVDIGQLATSLEGSGGSPQAPQFDEEAILRKAEERVLGRVQSQAQQIQAERIRGELSTFAESHEFFEDVRDTMGRLIQAGLAQDLASAYKEACERHPDIKRVISQREASKQAATDVQATQRARAAASSVKSTPVSPLPSSGAVGGDRRAQIEAAMAAAEGR